MIKSRKLRDQLQSTESIDSITHILENIASIRIGQIKDEVLGSREFFQRLWAIFSQLRVSSKDLAGQNKQPKNSKPAVVLVTANAGLTGEVDTKLMTRVLTEVDPKATDFYVYGLHGEGLLLQRLIKPVKTFHTIFKFSRDTCGLDIIWIVSLFTYVGSIKSAKCWQENSIIILLAC